MAEPESEHRPKPYRPRPSPHPSAHPRPGPRPRPTHRAARPSVSDLHLLRAHPDVRNRCLAALIVPFVLYTAVLLSVGDLHTYLVWIFAPTITAGVLFGALLDRGHKRYPEK